MDGNLQGVTNADVGSLIIQDVKAGSREIKAVKPGCRPQVDALTVAGGQVVAFTAKPFIPKVKMTREGDERETVVVLKVGSLRIQSVPMVQAAGTRALVGVRWRHAALSFWSMRSGA